MDRPSAKTNCRNSRRWGTPSGDRGNPGPLDVAASPYFNAWDRVADFGQSAAAFLGGSQLAEDDVASGSSRLAELTAVGPTSCNRTGQELHELASLPRYGEAVMSKSPGLPRRSRGYPGKWFAPHRLPRRGCVGFASRGLSLSHRVRRRPFGGDRATVGTPPQKSRSRRCSGWRWMQAKTRSISAGLTARARKKPPH